MKILALADIHGSHDVYARIPEAAAAHAVDAVVLAGDLLGVPDGYRTVQAAQRVDARAIVEILQRLEVPLLYIMGNDDLVELAPHTRRLRSVHAQRVDLGAYNFVGYQYSPPFMGGLFEKIEEEIAADLRALEPLMDRNTIFVTHSPGAGILDRGVLGLHAGSAAIRAAVGRRNVRAHIHGHIHQCFGRDGRHFNVAAAGTWRAIVLDLESLEHREIRS
ncbi:MAG: metallophosphoesterase family protein [Candidatus Latescibacterota bacterium]|nr:MAG: metallophosphoesterase family protein [Candidatus Latescibacterota bacterium]